MYEAGAGGISVDRFDQAEQYRVARSAEHPQAGQPVGVLAGAGPAGDNRGRAGVAGFADGGDDRRVVVAGRVAEPVDGDVETMLDDASGDRDLIVKLGCVRGSPGRRG